MKHEQWEEGYKIRLSRNDKISILGAKDDELERTIRFFTVCCKHCQMADLSCSAYMMCMCHSEQIEKIELLIPRWRKHIK